MALPSRAGSPNASGAKPAVASIIRTIPEGDEDSAPHWSRLIPAWIVSGVIHVVLLSLFLLVTVTGSAATAEMDFTTIVGNVQDDAKDPLFGVQEEGTDPTQEVNYNVPVIAEVSVPGPPATQAPGILNNPNDNPPQSMPAPDGFKQGQFGGINDPNQIGRGGLSGFEGGYIGGVKGLPGGFPGTGGSTRQQLLHYNGGNTRSEACVARGLNWLARHQRPNGSWGLHDFHTAHNCNCKGQANRPNDMAATGMALLPFLGAGETHRGVGTSKLYAKPVEYALGWIVKQQGVDGQLGDGYSHPIATIALCEAYGLTADPKLKGPAQRAIDAIVNWQAANGGFRYSPKQQGDLSVSGWHIQALKSGQMAGLHVPNQTFQGIHNFLDAVSTADQSGLGYTGPQATPRMTSVGLLCREYLGWGPRHPAIAKGTETLNKMPPSASLKDMYYYYYATQSMFHGTDEKGWATWNDKMRDLLIDTQDMGNNPDARDQKGSWSAEGDAFGPQMGRLGVTSLALLTLEVYYRRLPLYNRQLGAAKEEALKR
ncbi:MAG: terpene cyclase/mutase family protein [Gemmataceae bacterium]|nr:terpene cyclase/mutase family protein [Gemmataceae bacterium]